MIKTGESACKACKVLCIILIPFLKALHDLHKVLNKITATFEAELFFPIAGSPLSCPCSICVSLGNFSYSHLWGRFCLADEIRDLGK